MFFEHMENYFLKFYRNSANLINSGGMNIIVSGNEQKMFDWTKDKSAGKIDVSSNEHIIVQMNKKMFNRTKI